MDNFLLTLDSTAALIVSSLPQVLFFCFFLIIGWLCALLLKKLTKYILNKIHLEDWAEKLGIEQFLLKGGVRYTSTTLIANAVYWASLIFVILAGLKYLGVPIGEDFLMRVAEFIPRIIGAFIILVLGLASSKFVYAALLAYLNNLSVSSATTVARSCQIALVILTIMISIETLGIGGNTLITAFLMLFGALCLAIGISFGLAGRGMAKDILEKILKK